ncbi:MAG TPA: hypothetical protein VFC57_06065 [Aeromicrobium sp.]|nr:hypothetical protein [Aeromicrobium sp.]
MGQVSWRVDDELLEHVRHSAAAAGMSVNKYISRVLSLATSEDDESSEAQRMRQRLRAAGVSASDDRPGTRRVDDEEFVRLRRLAGHGTPLSDIVITDRA